MTQFAIEYDPQPPFDAGSPKGAGPEPPKQVVGWMEPFGRKMADACERASKALIKRSFDDPDRIGHDSKQPPDRRSRAMLLDPFATDDPQPARDRRETSEIDILGDFVE